MGVVFAPWTAWVGEAIGLAALVALVLFAVTYQTHADWRSTRPGRAIMHLVRGLIATTVLLILTGFVQFGPWRWIVEAVVYAPMAWACWNLYLSLRHQLGLVPRYLFRVRPKDVTDLFDTQDPK